MNADRMLARLTVIPTLLLIAWLVVSLPLLVAGSFTVGPTLILFVPAAAVILTFGLRSVRDVGGVGGVRGGEPAGRASWWAFGGVIAVTLGFLALELAMCSEQIVVRRDPASYVQFATWLTDHGSLPIPQMRWAFGGGDPALSYQSPAFYQRGGVLIPQFMAGLPLVLTLGGWIGGTSAMLAMAPILGACAVLAFAGLVARLVGPRWAPVGALLLALTLPMQWVSRATYSELPALVLLLGGLALLHDAGQARSGCVVAGQERVAARQERAAARQERAARAAGLLGGLALGLTVLVRIDGLRDVLPVVVFAGLLVARRHLIGSWLLAGLVLGAGMGLYEGFAMSGPYLKYLHASLNPLLLLSAAVVAGTAVLVALLRLRSVRIPLRRVAMRLRSGWAPDLVAICTPLVLIAFAARPYFQTVVRVPHNDDDRLNAVFVSVTQRVNGLPVEYGRQYSENSLYWVAWYIGLPAILLATFGAALLARRLLRRRSTPWLLPFATIAWTTLTTLWRPGITPDHPWASRRLISIVIPGLLLLALWALSQVVRHLAASGRGSRGATGAAAFVGVAVLLGPIVATSAALMHTRTEQGEVAAVRSLCGRLGSGASVVMVEPVAADRFSQVVRGMCGTPVARMRQGARSEDVRRVIDKIFATGRRPMILGSTSLSVAPYGRAQQVVRIQTRQDEHTLVTPPDGTWGLVMDLWLSEPLRA